MTDDKEPLSVGTDGPGAPDYQEDYTTKITSLDETTQEAIKELEGTANPLLLTLRRSLVSSADTGALREVFEKEKVEDLPEVDVEAEVRDCLSAFRSRNSKTLYALLDAARNANESADVMWTILDEAIHGLDQNSKAIILKTLRKYKQKYML